MAVISPRELYQDPELRQKFAYSWIDHSNLDDILESLEPVVQQPDLVQVLDDLEDEDRDTWFNFKKVLTGLPPETIFNCYGEEVLVWAAVNASSTEKANELKDTLEKYAGYDKELLEKARLWCWRVLNTSKGKDILSQYALANTLLEDNALRNIDLAAELQKAAKEGVIISEQRVADYSLSPITTEDKEPTGYIKGSREEVAPNIVYSVWLDAPVGFILSYRGRPQAAAGLSIKGNELMIYQLQGLKGSQIDPNKKTYQEGYIVKKLSARGLMPLDWQRLMIGVTTRLAKNIGLGSVGIQTGSKNYWTKRILSGETEPHLSHEAAHKAYDTPAKRLGFMEGKDANWHKVLQ